VRTFVTPDDLSTPLKPLVSANIPVPKNTFKGYTGITDGRLWLDKVKEYVEHGEVNFEVTNTAVEKY
jgi:large subunit ribosomal protein L41